MSKRPNLTAMATQTSNKQPKPILSSRPSIPGPPPEAVHIPCKQVQVVLLYRIQGDAALRYRSVRPAWQCNGHGTHRGGQRLQIRSPLFLQILPLVCSNPGDASVHFPLGLGRPRAEPVLSLPHRVARTQSDPSASCTMQVPPTSNTCIARRTKCKHECQYFDMSGHACTIAMCVLPCHAAWTAPAVHRDSQPSQPARPCRTTLMSAFCCSSSPEPWDRYELACRAFRSSGFSRAGEPWQEKLSLDTIFKGSAGASFAACHRKQDTSGLSSMEVGCGSDARTECACVGAVCMGGVSCTPHALRLLPRPARPLHACSCSACQPAPS